MAVAKEPVGFDNHPLLLKQKNRSAKYKDIITKIILSVKSWNNRGLKLKSCSTPLIETTTIVATIQNKSTLIETVRFKKVNEWTA